MKKLRRLAFLVLAVPFAVPCARAGYVEPDSRRVERLVGLCKVWGTVRYLHPYLACKDIDWDAALVEALPKVEAAKDENEFRAAVQAMLDRLGDPGTRVARKRPQEEKDQPGSNGKDPKDHPLFTWVEKDILAIQLDPLPSVNKLIDPKTKETVLTAVGKASGVILDLRAEDDDGAGGYILNWLYPVLPSREIRPAAERYLVHSGYRPQTGMTSGGYFSAFQTTFPELAKAAPGGTGKRIVLLVAERTDVPSIIVALQEAGEAFIVAQGKAPTAPAGRKRTVPLTEGFTVQIRTSELVAASGRVRVQSDAEVPAEADRGPNGPAFQKALAFLRTPPKAATPANATDPAPQPQGAWRPDKTYETMVFPSREYRLLALFRFWNVIHFFYPYKALLDQDWDTVLPQFLPKFEAARDAREYALAIAEMAAQIQDSHTSVTGSKELTRFFGAAAPPVALRLIEGKPTVTDDLDAGATKGSGVAIGDVVVTVDGEPVETRMARIAKYTANSNPNSQLHTVLYRLLNGPDGSTLKLTVRGGDDKTREIALPRKTSYARGPKRTGEVIKLLEDNIGYCDLERLTREEVDSMLERFKMTRAIVFDLRGYPQGTAWRIAPRLNVRGAKYGAAFQRVLLSGGSTINEDEARFAFLQPVPTSDKWKYKGKIVTLIDDRAMSQSEHTGLFLEAACGTTFIGSPTAGANGDITFLCLPGGITVRFTGHDVRHADGRQLQRIGLLPHIEVRPTLAGIRAGKDEVLARALQYLREGK
jgi:C-terminal processing protease CtpA/Prc